MGSLLEFFYPFLCKPNTYRLLIWIFVLLIDAANSKFDLFNNTINFSIDELMMYIVDSYDPKASNQLHCKFS